MPQTLRDGALEVNWQGWRRLDQSPKDAQDLRRKREDRRAIEV